MHAYQSQHPFGFERSEESACGYKIIISFKSATWLYPANFANSSLNFKLYNIHRIHEY